jgi:ElaB/YqjD/DUF883 family membrane-anchored ribosome-binding protein
MKYEQYTGAGEGKRRNRSPEEIESDVHEIRSELSQTLQRLEERFSPRAILDQLFSRARGVGQGSGEFVGNVGATVRDNPVPVLLLAAGVASLIASERMSVRGRRGQTLVETEEDAEGDGGRIESIKAKAREAKAEAKAKAREARETFGGLGERARHTSMELSQRMRGRASELRNRGSQTVHEQPLVIIGLGVAVGALLGAGLPVTERERRTFGPSRDRMLSRARDVAREGAERVREGAERVRDRAERVKGMAERAGASIGETKERPSTGPEDIEEVEDIETDERMES